MYTVTALQITGSAGLRPVVHRGRLRQNVAVRAARVDATSRASRLSNRVQHARHAGSNASMSAASWYADPDGVVQQALT